MNRILQIAIGTTIGILAAILIVVGAGAAWRAHQVAKARAAQAEIDAAQARQDTIDRAENLRLQRAARIAKCKESLSEITRPAQEWCEALHARTQFGSVAQHDANIKQCLADIAACRSLMAQHKAGAR